MDIYTVWQYGRSTGMIKKLEDICTVYKKNMSGQVERWAGREGREVSQNRSHRSQLHIVQDRQAPDWKIHTCKQMNMH